MADGTDTKTTVLRGGRLRWILGLLGFAVGLSVLLLVSVLLLHTAAASGDRLLGSERLGSLLGLALFVSLIAVPAYLLAIRTASSE